METLSIYDFILRHITLGGVIIVLTILAKDHKIWVRLTDEVDCLWKEFCQKHDIQYKSLRNGSK